MGGVKDRGERARKPPAAADLVRKRSRSESKPGKSKLEGRSLLGRIERTGEQRPEQGLDEAWEKATDTGRVELPHRRELEQRLGRDLGGVNAYVGPSASSLLDRLGAAAASRGQDVLLRTTQVDPATVAHEAVHTLQSRNSRSATEVVAESHAAEREADAVVSRIFGGVGGPPPPLLARLGTGQIALRRAIPTITSNVDELEDIPVPHSSRPRLDNGAGGPARLRPPRSGEPEAPPAPVQDTEVSATAETEAEQPQADTEADSASTEAPPLLDVQLPPPGANRPEQITTFVSDTQHTWDEGEQTADGHEVEPCPRNAVGPGERPFARGPPIELPAPVPDPDLPATAPRHGVPTTVVDTESGRLNTLQNQLPRLPTRTGPPPPAVTGEDGERLARLRRNRERNSPLPSAPDLTSATVGQDDDARVQRSSGDRSTFATNMTTARDDSRAFLSAQDFGDDRLAPANDPTLEHDSTLDNLQIEDVDVDGMLDTQQRARVPNLDNAGLIPIGDVVLVQDADFTDVDTRASDQDETRAQIDREITQSEAAFSALCQSAGGEKASIENEATAGVQSRRTTWSQEMEAKVTERTAEGAQLVTSRTAEANGIASTAESTAQRTITDAHANARTEWTNGTRKVEEREDDAADESLLESAARAFGDWLRDLVQQLTTFLEALRGLITRLLQAAAKLARAIIDEAKRAIDDVFDLLRDGLDFLARHLPGELGDIIRRNRDAIFGFLDGVQQRFNQWADELAQDIDNGIDGLIETLDQAITDLQTGIETVGQAMDDLLENGLMSFLRGTFPELAALVDEGLIAPINQAAEHVGGWLDGVMERTGVKELERTLATLHAQQFCQEQTPEQQAEACADFEQKMNFARIKVKEIIDSPFAQRVRGLLEQSRDQQADQQLSVIDGFMRFINWAARPVYEWWQRVEPQVDRALTVLGEIASSIWRHIAVALGLDPNLPPLEAITQGLQRAWEAIVRTFQPVIDAVKGAWRWIKEESFLAPLFSLIERLPELWTALGQLWEQASGAVTDWLGRAAQLLKDTILPPLKAALRWVSRQIHRALGFLDRWANRILGFINQLVNWETASRILQALMTLVRVITTPVRLVIRLFIDCALPMYRSVADVIGNLLDYVGTFLDIAAGIFVAIATMPIGIALFFAGNIWLHLVPFCYKAALINFFLDVVISFVQFFPEPAGFIEGAMHHGLLVFLRRLRGADDRLKVGAVDLFASIFAGNAEFVAGVFVGLLQGLWEETGGTIIFLIQAAAWLITLPLRLAMWAARFLTGQTGDEENARGPPGDTDAAQESAPVAEPDGSTTTVADTADALDDDAPQAAPQRGADADDVDGAGPTRGRGASNADPDNPPEGPGALGRLREILTQVVTDGFTRAELQSVLEELRAGLRSLVGGLAQSAADTLIQALNAPGTAYNIGRILGMAIAIIVVEAVIAYFTAGIGTALTAAKAAVQGARAGSRLGTMFNSIRRAVEPLLELVQRFRRQLDNVVDAVKRWFDDVVDWIRGIFRRAPNGPTPRVPHGPRPPRAPNAPNAPNRPRNGPDAPNRPRDGPDGPNRPRDGPDGPNRPRDPDSPDRPRDRDGPDAPLRPIAERLADVGWIRVRTQASRSVLPASRIRGILNSTPLPRRPGIRFDLDIDHRLTDGWRVRATARRRGGLPVHGHAGRGWRARDSQRRNFYTSASDQDSVHRRALHNADERIEEAAASIARNETDMREIHRRLQPDIRRIESHPRPSLLGGITMRIDERRRREVTDARGRPAFRYPYDIGPNNHSGHVTASLPALPRTRVRYDTMGAGFAARMVANPLSREGSGGGVPTATNPMWQRLLERRTRRSSYYVRGHMLNHRVHGPGNTFDNLTPITRSANALHHARVEREVKRRVDRGEVLYYEMRAVYRRHLDNRMLGLIDRDDDASNEAKRVRRDIVRAEVNVPTALRATVREVGRSSPYTTQSTVMTNREIPNTIANRVPSDIRVRASGPDRSLQRLDLSAPYPALRPPRPGQRDWGQEALVQLPGVRQVRALALLARLAAVGGRFTSADQVAAVPGITETRVAQWLSGAAGFLVRLNGGGTRWDPDFT